MHRLDAVPQYGDLSMLSPLYWSILVPAALAGFFACRRRPVLRRGWLLACSGAFLWAVQPAWWWLTLLLVLLAWMAPRAGKRGAAAYAALAAAVLVGMKLSGQTWPMGLSFVILQCVAYAVDAARDERFRGTLDEVALYAGFFPKLSAGPVCRFGPFREQVNAAGVTADGLEEGLLRLSGGMAKKLLVADSLYPAAMAAFGGERHPLALALSLLCCSLYVYFDFSGCTDMALGVARMMGITLPENFRQPFRALSVRDFWRRWHMSLSGFLRDYVYIPLGGSRKGKTRTMLNLTAVFLLMGLWHGLTWNYLLFGVWHALFMVLERSGVLRPEEWRKPAAWAYTRTVTAIGFVIFMATGIPQLSLSYSAWQAAVLPLSPGAMLAALAAAVLLICEGRKLPAPLHRLLALVLLAACWAHMAAGGYMPMLYAQF